MKKIIIIQIICILAFSNNVFGQVNYASNNLFNFSADFNFTKTSDFGYGIDRKFQNRIQLKNIYIPVFHYKNGLSILAGINSTLNNIPRYSSDSSIIKSNYLFIPKLRFQYNFLFVNVAYNYDIEDIYRGVLFNHTKLFNHTRKSFLIELGKQISIFQNVYIELIAGYEYYTFNEKFFYNLNTDRQYSGNNYFFKMEPVYLFRNHSKKENTQVILKENYLLSFESFLNIWNYPIENTINYDKFLKIYGAKPITKNIILAAKLSYKDDVFYGQEFNLTPEVKYLFRKTFFVDLNYTEGVKKTLEKYQTKAMSSGIGKYSEFSENNILETRLFVSHKREIYSNSDNLIIQNIGISFRILFKL